MATRTLKMPKTETDVAVLQVQVISSFNAAAAANTNPGQPNPIVTIASA